MELEAREVTFYYPGKKKHPVLDHVNLTIAPGERVGLKGKSGRGKTTLCRLLAGYEAPKGGQILLDGKEVRACRGVCPVQMIWQHPETAVDSRLRMKETLAEAGIRLSGTRKSDPAKNDEETLRDRELLDRLGIREEWMDRFPSELSGGELQRFCLARALRPGVRFLLCDEITAMLDLVTRARIWNCLMEEAKKRGLGLLVVSHDEKLLGKVCTRVVEMEEQKV